jgi:hypothetical protein
MRYPIYFTGNLVALVGGVVLLYYLAQDMHDEVENKMPSRVLDVLVKQQAAMMCPEDYPERMAWIVNCRNMIVDEVPQLAPVWLKQSVVAMIVALGFAWIVFWLLKSRHVWNQWRVHNSQTHHHVE